MGRSGLEKNLKFLRVAQKLNHIAGGMGDLLARGALETMWSHAYERADDFLGTLDDIEITAGWRGEPGLLAKALLDCGGVDKDGNKLPGFIEPDGDRNGYIIHAFWEHAPPWVKRKDAAQRARQAEGKTISDMRREAGKKGAAARKAASGKQTADRLPSDGQASSQQVVDSGRVGKGEGEGRSPQSPPRGADDGSADKESPRDLFGDPVEESPPRLDFQRLYAAYPRKEGRSEGIARCERSIKTLAEYRDLEAAIAKYAQYVRDRDVEPDRVKHFSTFVGTPRGAKEPRWYEWRPSPEERAELEEQARLAAVARERMRLAAERAEADGSGYEQP